MSLFDVDKNIELIPISPDELKKDGWREEWASYQGMWFLTDTMPVNATRQRRFAKTIEKYDIILELYYSHDLKFHRWVVWRLTGTTEHRLNKYPETMDQLNMVINEYIRFRQDKQSNHTKICC